MKIITTKENKILIRFLYHMMGFLNFTSNEHKRLWINRYSQMSIAVPPLEVQHEIVHILDDFTLLSAELSAELKARKEQYEYYRDKLLKNNKNKVEIKTLDDVCNISAGGDVPKENFSKEKNEKYNIPIISNGVGKKALYGYTDIVKIDKKAVTIAARGTIGYAEYRDYSYYPIIRLISAVPKNENELNTKFLYYSLQGRKYDVPTTGIPQLTVPTFKKEKISIPEIKIQKKIVEVLDNFKKICSDLKIGLPAEIEARQKQYEFYRDTLLTYVATGKIILQDKTRQDKTRQAIIRLIQYVFGYANVEIQQIFTRVKGTPITAEKMKEIRDNDGEIKIFAGGKTIINAKEKDIPKSNITRVPSVIVQSRGIIDVIYYDKPFTFKNEMWAYTHNNIITLKYLYYVMKNNIEEFRKSASGMGSMPQISLAVTEKFKIALPDEKKQKEIVDILDNFNLICNDLNSGLPAEIEARQKQYEYYRDKLLTFKELKIKEE